MTAPTDKKGSRDKESTRLRLLDAVGTLLAREGFGALGVNAVAREAGVDKVLIYRYFGGMDELLRAFGQSGKFWPSIADVVGHDPSELMALSIDERWAKGLSRYAKELRRRPVTKEILARRTPSAPWDRPITTATTCHSTRCRTKALPIARSSLGPRAIVTGRVVRPRAGIVTLEAS